VKPLAKKLISVGRTIGPYLAIELVMPGGSLLAILLWLYRIPRYELRTPKLGCDQGPMSLRRHAGFGD
jgi:hypothetical protein